MTNLAAGDTSVGSTPSGGTVPLAEHNSATLGTLSGHGEGGEIHTVELYRKVRLACRDGMSERAAARHFGVSRQSVRKMLQFSVPPGYRRTAPVRRPKLDEFTGLIEQWLEDDRRHGYPYRDASSTPPKRSGCAGLSRA